MRTERFTFLLCLAVAVAGLGLHTPARGAEPQPVAESARQVPVAYDVDVLVVGGGSGAVSAAVAAAQSGARVFLAAPRPYLGEDLCATMRLWLEKGETPESDLARALFSRNGIVAKTTAISSLKFSYSADKPSSARHADTRVPSRLNDGQIGRSESTSVQYDAEAVAITADLGQAQMVTQAGVVYFNRPGDFSVASVAAEVSDDAKAWRPAGSVKCAPEVAETCTVVAPVGVKTRYVRLTIKRPANANRILLGEIALVPETKAVKAAPADGKLGPFRPMHIKKTLDDALLAAKVQYLYGCYVTEALRDEKGNLCGAVMANRAGRQAVLARVVIDATDRAWFARLAGARFQQYPAGKAEFQFIAVGGEPKSGDGISARKIGLAYPLSDFALAESKPAAGKKAAKADAKAAAKKENAKKAAEPKAAAAQPTPAPAPTGPADLIEYTLSLPMADGSFASFARAEQLARDLTWHPGIQFITDELFQVPPDPMHAAKAGRGAWPGVQGLALESFQAAEIPALYVLGGCADLPRAQAARLLRPLELLAMGDRLGKAAAAQARSLAKPGQPAIAQVTAAAPRKAGEVKELLGGVRPTQKNLPQVASPERALPVIGEYDVVVIGGGTGGAPAGIGAARNKARTLVIEYLHGLGGVGTLGLISKYYHGYRGGFNAEIAEGADWNPLTRAEWWRAAIRKEGGDIWFGAIGCGAFIENGRLRGAIVATPQGRGVVLARNVIDATGNSDIAAAAGAQTITTDATEPAVQGTGLPAIKPGSRYTNTDFTIVDETDMLDVWHLLVYSKSKYQNAFDLGQLIDTRERRRIVGDFYMTLPDEIMGRTYPDTICVAQSDFDTHGMTVDPYLLLDHPNKKSVMVSVPFRCMLPSGLENMMVTGLSMSAHRDAMPLLRMQPDVQNMGFAAGLIAATASRDDQQLRKLDLPAIQRQLAKLDIIPANLLDARDSFPLPAEEIAEAVKKPTEGRAMAIIVSHSKLAVPLLREAYKEAAADADKLTYARILATLRDPAGVETLIKSVDAQEWDKGWNYTGGGQYGSSLSPLDTIIVALGRTGDRRCLAPIFRKIAQLDETSAFSHYRAVALALEMLGDPTAAAPLAGLLAKPGIRGNATLDTAKAAQVSGSSPSDNSTRQTSIRELTLARALYRCGDKDGLGKQILEEYAKDLRGHLARHAQAVLDQK